MTQNTDNFDFQELRDQYRLLEERLDRQGEVDDELISEAVNKKLAAVNKNHKINLWYNLIITLLASLMLLICIRWQLAIPLAVAGLLGFYRQRKQYQMMDFDKWCGLSMADAREKVAEFKKASIRLNMLVYIPLVLLLVFGLYYLDLSRGEQIWAVALVIILGFVASFISTQRSTLEVNDILSDVEEIRNNAGQDVPVKRKRVRDSFPILFGTYLACYIFVGVIWRVLFPSFKEFFVIVLAGIILAELILALIDRRMRKK